MSSTPDVHDLLLRKEDGQALQQYAKSWPPVAPNLVAMHLRKIAQRLSPPPADRALVEHTLDELLAALAVKLREGDGEVHLAVRHSAEGVWVKDHRTRDEDGFTHYYTRR